MTRNTYKMVTAAVSLSSLDDCSDEKSRAMPTFLKSGIFGSTAGGVISDGNSASDGNVAVCERCFGYGTSGDPVLSDVKVDSVICAGDYTSKVFEFNAGTLHYQLNMTPIRREGLNSLEMTPILRSLPVNILIIKP